MGRGVGEDTQDALGIRGRLPAAEQVVEAGQA